MMAGPLRYIVMHATIAACFIFVLNFYVLNTGLQSAVFWAIGFSAMAGALAYRQTKS